MAATSGESEREGPGERDKGQKEGVEVKSSGDLYTGRR